MEFKPPVENDSYSLNEPSANINSFPWLATYPQKSDWSRDFKPVLLFDLLDKAAADYPDNPCTFFMGKTLTYKEIQHFINSIAKGLQLEGIGKGKKIGLLLPNTPTYIIFYYAILKTGATVVNYNPLYTVEELTYQIKDSETEILVTLDLKILFDKMEALLEANVLKKAIICPFDQLLPGLKSFLFKIFKRSERAFPEKSPHFRHMIQQKNLLQNDGKPEIPAIDLHKDIALLQYTGGTTGTPKGAMLSHANLSVNVMQIQEWAKEILQGQERIMGILPFFHVFAMTTVMNYGIAIAAELILVAKFELNSGLKLIGSKKPTIMPGVPTLYNALMNHPDITQYDLSDLKFCISGGAPLPVEIKKKFEKATGCILVEGYGLSETSPVASCNPSEGPTREGSIGLPLPQTILSIRSIDNPEQEMPLGENGEICIKGPQVMIGYWQQPEETQKVFTGEFFRTGDAGYMDQEGFTYIVDRLKDLIICSGFNVYPRRVEEAIYAFPGVEEVTVVGIPDEYRGEAPKAFIKMKAGHKASSGEIMDFLKVKISKIELPSEIEFRDTLPKTMVGKLSKKELKIKKS